MTSSHLSWIAPLPSALRNCSVHRRCFNRPNHERPLFRRPRWESFEASRFQDIFEHIPEVLHQYVPQYRMLVINLREFSYDHLPGRPETQAVVETMKRTFDGTLADRLPDVLGRLAAIPIDDRIMDFIASISWYCGRVTDIEPEQIFESITNIIKGKEGIEMSQMIQKGIFFQGKVEGKIEGKIEVIMRLLHIRFNRIPDEIGDKLNCRTDLVALDSLFDFAAQCKSIDEFADALK